MMLASKTVDIGESDLDDSVERWIRQKFHVSQEGKSITYVGKKNKYQKINQPCGCYELLQTNIFFAILSF
jgi:hypothetical protein